MPSLVGFSRAFRAALALADRYACLAMGDPDPEPVLIRGDTGVGKELVANRMHGVSGRPGGFIPVSAGELVDTLFHAQLFGHTDNAYTGAGKAAPGAFEHAAHGTLFLDELQTMRPDSQHALLRAIAERSVQRVRGVRRILTTCALLFASSVPMEELEGEGRLLKDLRHRIGYFEVYIPPLAERRVDIIVLAQHFLELRQARGVEGIPRRFSKEAVERLLTYRWPGNAREVERVVAFACIHGLGEECITLGDLPDPIVRAAEEAVDRATRADLAGWALEHGGNRARAAGLLGIHPNTLDNHKRGERVGGVQEEVARR